MDKRLATVSVQHLPFKDFSFLCLRKCHITRTSVTFSYLQEFELRKHARQEGRRYCDPVVLTYQAERMPEQIRLKVRIGGCVSPCPIFISFLFLFKLLTRTRTVGLNVILEKISHLSRILLKGYLWIRCRHSLDVSQLGLPFGYLCFYCQLLIGDKNMVKNLIILKTAPWRIAVVWSYLRHFPVENLMSL